VPSDIAGQLTRVRARIDAAARAAARPPESIRLVAVSKTFPSAAIREARLAGQLDFGENKVQEGLQKITESADLSIRWHLLGHLQRNKVRKAVAGFGTIQSVDSLDLLTRIDAVAAELGRSPDLLLQVDLAGETTKFGADPDAVREMLDGATTLRAARVVGLMTIPPVPDSPEEARPWFRQLRELRDRWIAAGVPPHLLRELSMGMSGDFEVAIEEGATIVRVGTAIFGSRHVQH
jgi:pyridoxal phosphate enzyme (YggS family)